MPVEYTQLVSYLFIMNVIIILYIYEVLCEQEFHSYVTRMWLSVTNLGMPNFSIDNDV